MKKVYLVCNGCDRRLLDSSRLENYFIANGYEMAGSPSNADYIIFVTCAFNESKEKDCFKLISGYSRFNAELIVLGCLPEISPGKFKRIFKGRYIPTKNMSQIDRLFGRSEGEFLKIPDTNFIYRDIPLLTKLMTKFEASKDFCYKLIIAAGYKVRNFREPVNCSRNRRGAYLRIGSGCSMKCSYCAIRNAVGELKSKPLDICLQEYAGLIKTGYDNIVIVADNVGAYGLDIGVSFADLMNEMSKIDTAAETRWIISELHPVWVRKYRNELYEKIADGKIIEILCPVQSGSDRILGLMNRDVTKEEIIEILSSFRNVNRELKLITDIILGFPTATEEDFSATIDLIKKVRFDLVNFFTYAEREGTLISGISHKVSRDIMTRRLKTAVRTLRKDKIEVLYL
ncbi:radical SAM protein [Elusimicrobiota bacterium]